MRLKFTLTHSAPFPLKKEELLQEGVCSPQSVFYALTCSLCMYVLIENKKNVCSNVSGILFGTLFYNLFFHLTWSFRLEGLNSEPSLWFHSPEGMREAETQSISADLAQREACLSLVGLPKGDYLFLIHSKMWCVCYI